MTIKLFFLSLDDKSFAATTLNSPLLIFISWPMLAIILPAKLSSSEVVLSESTNVKSLIPPLDINGLG